MAKTGRAHPNSLALGFVSRTEITKRTAIVKVNPPRRGEHFGFSADGKTFAAAFADKSVFLWEAETGQERRRLQLDESPSEILLRFDGSQLAVLDADTVDVWDVEAGKRLLQLPRVKDDQHRMSFGFQEGILATADDKTGIQIWSLETGKKNLTLDRPDSAVRCLAFSPDDKQLAAGLEDKTIRLFDLESKAEIAKLDAHSGPVTHVLFHPDGKQLVSGSENWELIHWDVSAQKARGTKRVLGGIENLFWGAEDRALMVEDARGRLFFIQDLEKPGLASALNEMDVPYERTFAYAKNTGQLAVVNTWGVRLLDTKTNRETDFLPEANVRAVEWAEDGRTLMVASGEVFAWDVVEQKEIYRISNAEINGGVTSLAKSPDGKIVAGGISSQKVCFWELRTGRLIREVSLARKIELPGWWFITSVQFSADGRLLFAMARDLYFVIEVESGLVWFQNPNPDPADTSFAVMGPHTLLSAEPRGTARLWSWAPDRSPRNDESPVRLWRGLTGHDGRTVYHAMFALAELKDDAVPFLKGQLSEIRNPGMSPEKIASLIEDLDKSATAQRNASEELRQLGRLARPHLHQALERENLSARSRSRIQILLAAQDREADPELLAVRSVQLLEWIGTRKAREALEWLAKDPSDRLGREANAAFRRLSSLTN